LGGVAPDALHDALLLHEDFPPPLALHDAFPAFALHEDLPAAAGVFGCADAASAPPQAIVVPASMPTTADATKVLTRFISSLRTHLRSRGRLGCFEHPIPDTPRSSGSAYLPRMPSEPRAGEPLYVVAPSVVYGQIDKTFPKSATRWTF
jgi:hypothetical protein